MIADLIRETETIDDVIGTMRRLDAALSDDDGVKWFNFLYLSVTEAVRAEAAAWQDWPFLQRFDVVFARLYFDAVEASERNPDLMASAWRPLFTSRHDTRLARLQFALAGMNAHINRDLPIALERTAAADGAFSSREGPRYRDFVRVNDILERTESSLRPMLANGLASELDAKLGDLDSLLVMWKVRKARDAAWTNGEVYWHLRNVPLLQRDYLTRLDRMVAFAGHGLLVPRLGVAGAVR
jgi:hypothetical protein